jgi:hypothetical protein
MVRPEQIRVFSEAGESGVAAHVRDVKFFGHDALVRFAVHGGDQHGDVTARLFSHSLPQPGEKVWLQVEGDVAAFAPSATLAFQGD